MTIVEEIHARHRAFHLHIARQALRIGYRPEVRFDQTQRAPISRTYIPPMKPPPKPLMSYDEAWHQEICGQLDCVAPPKITLKRIQSVVARHFNFNVAELTSSRRTDKLVRPRWLAFYLCREITGKSLPEIGRSFGNRDHTTVLHGLRKFEMMLHADDPLCSDYDEIREMLG